MWSGLRGVGDVWSGGRVEWVMCGVGNMYSESHLE